MDQGPLVYSPARAGSSTCQRTVRDVGRANRVRRRAGYAAVREGRVAKSEGEAIQPGGQGTGAGAMVHGAGGPGGQRADELVDGLAAVDEPLPGEATQLGQQFLVAVRALDVAEVDGPVPFDPR